MTYYFSTSLLPPSMSDGRQFVRDVWTNTAFPAITAFSLALIGILLVLLIVRALRG